MTGVMRVNREAREELFVRLQHLLAGHRDVTFAFVFGSSFEQDEFRDIDIGIWTGPSASPRLDVELAASPSAALGVPVDVRRVNDAPISFVFHVSLARGHYQFASTGPRPKHDRFERRSNEAPIIRSE